MTHLVLSQGAFINAINALDPFQYAPRMTFIPWLVCYNNWGIFDTNNPAREDLTLRLCFRLTFNR